MIKEESLSMTIRKATDNIEILMNGGSLADNGGNIISFVKVVMEDEDQIPYGFSLDELAEFTEYVIPKTERELVLEERISELEAQITAGGEVPYEHKVSKGRVVLDASSKLKIAQEWKRTRGTDDELNGKETAAKYGISDSYLKKFLKELGVYEPRKRKQKVTKEV